MDMRLYTRLKLK